MPTITWYRSEPQPQVLTFRPAGDPLTGASAEVVIAGSVHIPLTPVADGFEWDLADVPPSLPSRTWRAALIITWPDSSIDRDDFLFRIRDSYPQQTDRITAIEVAGQEWRRPPPPPVPPSNTAMPVIDITGNDWSITPGTWDNADSVATVVTLGGDPVGLTGTIAEADDGKTLLVVETATNADGATEVQVSEQVQWQAPPHPLAAYAGTGAGQMPIITDMLWPGAHTVGDDAGTPVVTGLTNLGGTGAYHGLAADGVTTAPRLDQDAMLFRLGDLIRMANEAGLSGVHAIMEVYLVNPGLNEVQALAGHSGVSAGSPAQIQYMRQNANNRFRLQNLTTSQATYVQPGGFVGAWRVIELRYNAATAIADFAIDGVAQAGVSLAQGGDLYVNLLGGTLRNQHIGAMVSVVSDPAHGMADPEAAVLAARSYLIGRRA